MPRSGRGGSRQGATGKAYPNRSDLNGVKPLAVSTAPSGEYGQAAAQAAAQQAVPMAPGPVAPGAAPQGAPPQAPTAPAPGFMDLLGPTARPDEPVTAGSPSGPGPGPSPIPVGPGRLSDILSSVAALTPGASDLLFLADRARELGQ